jgi:hypothetical protein
MQALPECSKGEQSLGRSKAGVVSKKLEVELVRTIELIQNRQTQRTQDEFSLVAPKRQVLPRPVNCQYLRVIWKPSLCPMLPDSATTSQTN